MPMLGRDRNSLRSMPKRLDYGIGAALLWLVIVPFVCGGATCARRKTLAEFQPPIVFSNQPTLQEIMSHVNRSMALQQLESNNLTVNSPELAIKLRGNVKWERPHNFKLEAHVPGGRAFGMAMSAGSNAEGFWLLSQTPSPPTLYYARHDEFENQAGPRRILPVSPLWIREAMGVVELDPGFVHQDPIVRPDGKLEVRSMIPSPRGDYRRSIVLDASTGVIEQTLLYNHVGKLIAVAQQSEHQYFSAIDFSLPHRVDVQLHPDEGPLIAFTIEVGFYMVNQGTAGIDVFTPPDSRGLTQVDLALANASAGPIQSQPPRYTSVYQQSVPAVVPSGYTTPVAPPNRSADMFNRYRTR